MPRGGLVNTFSYDANGLRTQKNDSTGTTKYLLEGTSVAAEYDGSSNLAAIHINNPQHVDEQFALTQAGTKYWPVCDELGSVFEWVSSAGAVASSYGYDVYGARTQNSGGLKLSWGYTGREHEPDSGLIYSRDRYRAANYGLWTQPDRLRLPSSNNRFAYANLNPISNSDPSGYSSLTVAAAAMVGLSAVLGVEYMLLSSMDDDGLDVANFAAGFGDGVSMKLTLLARQWTRTDCHTNYNSTAYNYGLVAGFVVAFMLFVLWISGAAATGVVTVTSWGTAESIASGLRVGMWVEIGGPSLFRYLITGVIGRYSPAIYLVAEVEAESLKWPDGIGGFLVGLLGHRIYDP